jgi:iron complex transport system ATP-binding protein
MSFLSVETLSFSYPGGGEALQNVSFNVEAGEHIALVGPNGSGKTTLFQLLSGYYKPSGGTALLDGRPVHRYPVLERARRIALVPQGGRIGFPFTCLEIALMGLHPHRSRFAPPDEKAFARVRSLMIETGVWAFAGKKVNEISGGELQRVLLTRALLQILPESEPPPPPRLLLLDESLSELDISARFTMMKLLVRYAHDYRVTVIGIHHDLHIAGRFASRIIALRNGCVAADGSPAEVFISKFFSEVFLVKAEIIPPKGFIFYDNLEQ